MKEHFSKNTVEASLWCKKCGKFTMHSVVRGLQGTCLTCMTEPLKTVPKKPPATQRGLF